MELINYYKLLSKEYPNIDAVSEEIINLSAILKLPKVTEHFVTDIHGEFEAFNHIIRNASGTVKRKIDITFGDKLSEKDKKDLASLVYYPKEKLSFFKSKDIVDKEWYEITIYNLILLIRKVSYKYTRSKVRKSLPKSFDYIIEELMQEQEELESKQKYFDNIIKTIVSTQRADEFIVDICNTIVRLVVDRLHIVGDIYDRGPSSDLIMDDVIGHHNVDIQWGNHDIIWMGAASGSKACMANVVRIALRYGNMKILQEGYGINLMPLASLALEKYTTNSLECFQPKLYEKNNIKEKDIQLLAGMQKAVAIIQFKLEGQIIKRNPDFKMEDRLLLDKIRDDFETVEIGGEEYPLLDNYFPTLDIENPYLLSEEEEEVVNSMCHSFMQSERLQKHAKTLFSKGSIYLKCNDNLLYHACIPMNGEKEFQNFIFEGKEYSGKELCDFFDLRLREGFFNKDERNKKKNLDLIWYNWCGPISPLFGKDKMTTFERYFIEDKKTHKEDYNDYFRFRDEVSISNKILKEFGIIEDKGKIITGHIPVKAKRGESPVKAEGKLFVIDGGFSYPYQKVTGIAGYTLIYNSQAIILVSHEPFETHEATINENVDMIPKEVYVHEVPKRVLVEDTDDGKDIKATIEILKELLNAYRKGLIDQK
ncbi:MAG: fructose-1,6-bisphosphatase [Eubacteriales bacterium]